MWRWPKPSAESIRLFERLEVVYNANQAAAKQKEGEPDDTLDAANEADDLNEADETKHTLEELYGNFDDMSDLQNRRDFYEDLFLMYRAILRHDPIKAPVEFDASDVPPDAVQALIMLPPRV